jgi:photosystem II stability/assembly factor-like uncharacterized protein
LLYSFYWIEIHLIKGDHMRYRTFTILLTILLGSFLMDIPAWSQEFDSLIVAPEVLLNGVPPAGLMFKPGRILDANTIWFCGVDGSNKQTYVFRSINGGATFTHNATAIDDRAAQVDAFDADTAIVANANGKIYKTTDGGLFWTEVYSYTISVIAPGWFDGCRVLNDHVAVAFGDMEPNGNMHFARTENKGDTWNQITTINYMNAAYGYYTWGSAACNVGESIWCAATTVDYDSSYVFRSYDAGITWDSFKIPNEVIPNYPRSIAFTDNNHGMIAARGGYVIKTIDGGTTWSETLNPDTTTGSASYVNGLAAIPGTNIIVAFDDIGVYYTSDLGETWGHINASLGPDDDDFVGGVFLNTDFGFVFTYDGKVLRFKNQVSDVSEPYTHISPNTFSLNQNYPNPFNPLTEFEFTLPKAAEVKIAVYDINGRLINTLVNANFPAGRFLVKWDGTDASGQKVSSGTYFYTMEADQVTIAKKMILVK